MTAMGALNVTLDKKTKDMVERMAIENSGLGPENHRRRTMENVANLAINSQIELILPPDGEGDSMGGGPTREHVRRGWGRGRGQGRAGRGRNQHVGALQPNGKLKCNVLARFQG